MLDDLLALGYLPGVVCGGTALLRHFASVEEDHDRSFSLALLAAGTAIGLLLGVPVLFATAWFGVFSAAWIGAAGWLVAVATAGQAWAVVRRLDGVSYAVLGFATLLFAWNGIYASESIFAGRDQGVYSNHGAHIARTGSLFADPPYHRLMEGHRYVLASAMQAGGYFFDRSGGFIYLQFPPTFALLLAQAFGVAGYSSLFLLNPLLSALNAAACFAFARQFLTLRWAILATVFFACNLAQVWNARITLSEILAQTYLLTGSLLCYRAVEKPRVSLFCIGCGLVSFSAFVRIDAFLATIALAAACLLLGQRPSGEGGPQRRKLARAGALTSVATALLACGYGFLTSPGYFDDFTRELVAMLACAVTLAVAVLIPLPESWRQSAYRVLATRQLWAAIMVLVTLLALYAYFVRPHIQPFAFFPEGGSPSGRDYRENSLRDVSAYISPVATALALVGFGYALRRVLDFRGAALSPFIAVWLCYTLLYLYNPIISPDHIWKIRRFTPIVIPGFTILAALGGQCLLARLNLRKSARHAAYAFAAIALAIFLSLTLRPIAFTKLHAGSVAFVKSILERIPENALIVAQVSKPLLGPIQLAEGRSTIRSEAGKPLQQLIVSQAVQEESAKGRPVIYASETPFAAHPNHYLAVFSHTYPGLNPTSTPLPAELEEHHRQVYLMEVGEKLVGFPATLDRLTLGPNPILGVDESGFHATEKSLLGPIRWTTGSATLRVPWIFPHPPQSALLQILSARPGGSSVRLFANGQLWWAGQVPPTGATVPLPVSEVDWSRSSISFALYSEPWQPSEVVDGATDQRELGGLLGGLHLQFREWTLSRNKSFGTTFQPGISETGLHSAETASNDLARWTDGHATFQFKVSPTFSPQQLELELRSIHPNGSQLKILWNGKIIHASEVTSAPWRRSIPLDSVEDSETVTLEIVSNRFVPAELDPRSTDQRHLGVMIDSLDITGVQNP